MQEEGNIMDFYVNGDVAPSGRFNYHYFSGTVSGVNENRQTSFSIYPNPAANNVKVSFSAGITAGSELSIYCISGRKLWSKRLSDAILTDEIDLGFIKNKGIYIVELNENGKYSREKLMVN